ncbi:EAL domain-containing protein [Rhodoferax sp. GW822-FHT02A01]|uniref:sensor domain-containing protein n=1 Tax=Rhodoferax sp. GW822-FHT02A01 TaxID=3141537 RepID=UPI00315C5F37
MTPAYFQAIVDSSDDAIVGKTLDGIVTSWNRGAETIFGYTAQEMLGQSLLILFPQDRLDEERFILKRMMEGERIDHFETVRIRKDGKQVHVSVSISPIRNAQGVIIGASKVARDITPLKMEQERLKLALDATCNGLWDWDLRTGRVYRSDHYYAITGHDAGEDDHSLDFFWRTVHSQDVPNARQAMADHIAGRSDRIEFEYRLVSKTGQMGKWIHARGQAVERDAWGTPTRIVGTLSDITPSKLFDVALRDREKRLSRVLEGSDQGYWDWNVQTNYFQVSARWESMLGYAPGEMDVSTDHWAELVHPDDFPSALQSIERHLRGETASHEAEMRVRTKTGEWKWILTRGKVVEYDADGMPLMMSGTHTDISERKVLEQAQREALTVFANSYEGIMVVDVQRLILRVNPAFTRITGYQPEEVLGKSPGILSSGRQNERFYRDMWHSIESTGFWSGEIWNRRKNGEIYAQILSISQVTDGQGRLQHYVGLFSDISQIKAHEEELDRVAHYDPLTGTPNRRLLGDRLAQAIARTDRSVLSLAVCYLDLDGFKGINDRFGHVTGDKLLVGVAESLKAVLRSEDTLARLGGDEFVLLLADIESPEECSLILERILLAANVLLNIDDNMVRVSASIGVTLYPQDSSDADTLMRHADQAMYLAKEAGKNRFHLFDPESDRKAQEHREFVERLTGALQQQEFCLYYQPKIDLLTGEVQGVEALLRWQHPERGLLRPAAFLPHVQGTRLERPLGIWVMQAALAQMQLWLSQGHVVKVSINVSATHLLSAEFIDDLREALAMYPEILPASLELEVLETTAIDDITLASFVLDQCRSMGVNLALDDFGTGYSSLTYLRKLPFEVLKIDQSFVRDMLRDAEDLGIVEGVIRLASAFHRSVIAEGVETMEHGAALLKLGCRMAQGYGIARPMRPEAYLDWIKTWKTQAAWLAIRNV